jgi:hypothetical protein
MMKARLFLALFVSVLAAACERVALTAPTASTITITTDQSVLPLNGTATVRAVVIESGGTPVHNGTTVTFTSTLGNVDPVEATTVNGIATALFRAGGTSGKSTIKAFSGGAATETGVDVTIGSAAARTIALTATPSSVSQSGGTVTVSALVLDESGNALPGVPVNFSADTGQLNPTTALSDSSGTARTQLSTTATSKVTATAGTATKDVTVNVSTAPSATIDVVPASPFAGMPAAITVTPAAAGPGGARQVQSVTVDFGDGTSQTASNPTGAVGFTHTYQRSGGYTITARSTDVGGNTGIASRAIIVQSANPTAGVSASPNSGAAPLTSTITVTAAPTAGGPPLQSVRTFVNGEQVMSGTGGGSFAYRFTSAGTYNVSVIVTDAAGNESRANTIVIVN